MNDKERYRFTNPVNREMLLLVYRDGSTMCLVLRR
jgi:hypothetical protein